MVVGREVSLAQLLVTHPPVSPFLDNPPASLCTAYIHLHGELLSLHTIPAVKVSSLWHGRRACHVRGWCGGRVPVTIVMFSRDRPLSPIPQFSRAASSSTGCAFLPFADIVLFKLFLKAASVHDHNLQISEAFPSNGACGHNLCCLHDRCAGVDDERNVVPSPVIVAGMYEPFNLSPLGSGPNFSRRGYISQSGWRRGPCCGLQGAATVTSSPTPLRQQP